MLKVVGASWEKTRLTTIMLIAVLIIAIFAIFFYEVPLQENDGHYSASVLWSEKLGFREIYWGQNNDPKTVNPGVARAYYKPDMASTGWSTIEIQTQPSYPDWIQAYAAGLLEGSLCWQLIYWHWQNTINVPCQNREQFCDKIRKQLQDNSDNIRKVAAENDNISPYWHQVNLFYTQLDGLEAGWRNGVIRSRKSKILKIPKIDFLWMNSGSDLKDLEQHYNSSRYLERTKPLASITVLKYSPNVPDQFLLAHEAAGFYNEMLRLHKRYDFGYHMTSSKNSPLTPGQEMVFTSYPAALYSQDDFYQIKGEKMMTVAGVGITNFNRTLWNETYFPKKVIMAPRVLAANRLSKNGKEWGKILALKQSGTGNKHWLVISGSDKNERTGITEPIALWVVEQIPGLTIFKNQTNTLRSKGYWINVGIPYYDEILQMAGYRSEKNGEAIYRMEFLTPVQNVLIQGSPNVKDTGTLTDLMRSPEITAAGRSDVVIVNVTNENGDGDIPKVVGDNGFSVHYTYHGSHHNEKGATHPSNQINGFHDYFKGMIDNKNPKDRVRDMDNNIGNNIKWNNKEAVLPPDDMTRELSVTEYAGIIDLKVAEGHDWYNGIAGPPYNPSYRVEPFSWSNSLLRKVPHYGQVDLWAFHPVRPIWVW
ncbi:hypothetical protein O3M35_000660 [Rhynocoris fuscipes]|uniref:Phospholipase B-like n=1 Tax=Rhynocoris fuscipes TaxID=488301 RepID=A0AAW1DML4_9HEMI